MATTEEMKKGDPIDALIEIALGCSYVGMGFDIEAFEKRVREMFVISLKEPTA